MDNVLLIILAGFGVALALTFLRPAPPPQIIIVAEPQPSGGLSCLLPLIVVGSIILFALLVVR